MIPSCAPSAAMTRSGLMRICLFTRTRFVVSWILGYLTKGKRSNEKREPLERSSRAFGTGYTFGAEWLELLQHASL